MPRLRAHPLLSWRPPEQQGLLQPRRLQQLPLLLRVVLLRGSSPRRIKRRRRLAQLEHLQREPCQQPWRRGRTLVAPLRRSPRTNRPTPRRPAAVGASKLLLTPTLMCDGLGTPTRPATPVPLLATVSFRCHKRPLVPASPVSFPFACRPLPADKEVDKLQSGGGGDARGRQDLHRGRC